MESARTSIGQRAVVHVTIERLFETVPRGNVDDLLTFTERLDDVLRRYGARWLRPSAEEAVLAARSRTTVFDSRATAMDWAGSMRRDVRAEVGVDCSVGIAATQVAARVCSRMARPRGVLLWLAGYEEALLARLPIEELDELRSQQLARLRAAGVTSLGALSRLSPERARSLLGSEASKVLSLVRGVPDHGANVKPKPVEGSVRVLARRLAGRLSACQREARGLELRLTFEGGICRERYTLLPRATASAQTLGLAAERLATMASREGTPLRGLSLTATGLTPGGRDGASSQQLGLFALGGPRDVTVRLGRR